MDLKDSTSASELRSTYPKDIVQDTADSLGISTLTDEAAQALAVDVEYRLREIAQEAVKFMRHSRRNVLTVEDINHSIRVRSVEPLYGFNTSGGINFEKVVVNNQDLYYMADQEVDFDQLLSTPLPPAPADIIFTAHWLAVEGIQPAIPQNPSQFQEPVELPLKKKLKPPSTPVEVSSSSKAVEVRPLVKHILCRELRVYFERVASAVVGNDVVFQEAAFVSLRSDPGLQNLLPHFIQFVIEKITKSMRQLPIIWSMLTFIDALLTNPNFFIEPYLHQLMPPLLTCILANNLGTPTSEELSHWKVRHRASELVAKVCSQFGSVYPTLQPRIFRTMLRALLDPVGPLPTLYGAIIGIGQLGPYMVSSCVATNLDVVGARIQSGHQKGKSEEATKISQAIIEVLVDTAKQIPTIDEQIPQSELEERLKDCPSLLNALRNSKHISSILSVLACPTDMLKPKA